MAGELSFTIDATADGEATMMRVAARPRKSPISASVAVGGFSRSTCNPASRQSRAIP